MKIIVTGATSFIGAAVIRQLLMEGHQVIGVVRPDTKHMEHLHRQVPAGKEAWLQVAALGMERIGELVFLPSAAGSEAWIQIGWEGAGSANRIRRDVQQGNVVNSLSAIKAAAALGCSRFLFTGSQAEYGIHHEVVDEETPLWPVSEYGKAKADFANLAKDLCKSLKIEYIHTRIFSVYGPGDHPWSLVQSCLRTWQQGGHMELGACTQQWNFLYIEDTAAALVHLLTEGRPGVYNVASADTRCLREYMEQMYAISQTFGGNGSFTYGDREPNAEGQTELMPDITKILTATSWRPVTSFTEGIYETLHCLRSGTA